MRFTYDVSGLLEVEAISQSTGRKEALVISQLAGALSPEEVAEAQARMALVKVPPREEAANILLNRRIEALYAQARGAERDWLSGLLLQMDAAMGAQDKQALAALRSRLHAALDDYEAGHVR